MLFNYDEKPVEFEFAEEFDNEPADFDGDYDAPDGYDFGGDDYWDDFDQQPRAGDEEQHDNNPSDKNFTQEDVDKIIDARLARERARMGNNQISQHAQKFQQLMGVPLEDAVKQLEQEAEQERVQQRAQLMGIHPQQAQMLMQQEQRMKQLETQNQTMMQRMANDQQRQELREAPFFNDYESEIDEVVKTVPGVDLKTAYTYVLGEHINDILENNATGARQKTLKEVQKGAKSFVEGSGEGDSNAVQLPKEMVEMASVYGVSPKALAKRLRGKKK